MSTKKICWFNDTILTTPEIVEFLVNNEIAPMLNSSYAVSIWKKQKELFTMRDLFYSVDDVMPYKDEPFSHPKELRTEQWIKSTVATYPYITMGESSTEDIARLISCGVNSITFTAYGEHIVRIKLPKWLGGKAFNLRYPGTSQLKTWQKLDELYGESIIIRDSGNPKLNGTLKESKFKVVCIMLDQEKYFDELISWAITHGKNIIIVAPDKWQNNKKKIFNGLTAFVKVFNKYNI